MADNRPYTPEEDETILTMYQEGATFASIGRLIGRKTTTVEYRYHTLMRYKKHDGRMTGRPSKLCGDCSFWTADPTHDEDQFPMGTCAITGGKTDRCDWCECQ